MITKEQFNKMSLDDRVDYLKTKLYAPVGADLSSANLTKANLAGADLVGVGLSEANLVGATLVRAELLDANLSRANMSSAHLAGARLSGACLFRANLSDSNLNRADLYNADLGRANLSGANLLRANLSEANLSMADLSRTDLSWVDLSNANLTYTPLDPRLHKDQRKFAIKVGQKGLVLYRTKYSQHCGAANYIPGKTYVAPWFSLDINTACHPGIYATTKEWMLENYSGARPVKVYVRGGDYVFCRKGCVRCKRIRVLEDVK